MAALNASSARIARQPLARPRAFVRVLAYSLACLTLGLIWNLAVDAGSTQVKCAQPKRVALLMYGEARSLNMTHCSIRENVVAPFLDAGHSVHVFVSASDDDDAWQYGAFINKCEETFGSQSFAGKVVVETPTKPPGTCVDAVWATYEKSKALEPLWGKPYVEELLVQYAQKELASTLRRKHEAENDAGAFDIVALVRPDVQYASKLQLQRLPCTPKPHTVHAPRWQQYLGMNDRMLIASPPGAAFNHYVSLYSGLCLGDEKEGKKPAAIEIPRTKKGLNSERLYAWWMRRHDLAGYADKENHDIVARKADELAKLTGLRSRLAVEWNKQRWRFTVSTNLLRDFVFYRVRRGETPLSALSQSPDAIYGVLAKSWGFGLGTGRLGWNSSPKRWVDVLKDVESCEPLVKKVEGSD